MSTQLLDGYAGDVSVIDAYSILEKDQSAVLVDVRTKAEWTYVGAPDLSGLGKETIFVEWQEFPSMKVAPDFTAHLLEIFARVGFPPRRRCCFCVVPARARARRRLL